MENHKFRKITVNKKGYLNVPYFAYGSNLELTRMKGRCPKANPLEAVVAKDYRLTFKGNARGLGVADIEPDQGETVVGALYEVTPECLKALDRYEGWPRLYDRYLIEVEDIQGRKTVAFVYRMGPEYTETPPGETYFDIIVEGYHDWELNTEPLHQAREALLPKKRKWKSSN